MATRKDRAELPRCPTPREHTRRLRLKPTALHTGCVDGAWWPHTHDLGVELPDLLAVLAVRLGPVERVVYQFSEWTPAPATLDIGGRAVHLDRSRLQPADTVDVLGLCPARVVMLVVPPCTDPERAHAAMMAAAASDDDSTVDDLLMISAHDRQLRIQRALARERWYAGRWSRDSASTTA